MNDLFLLRERVGVRVTDPFLMPETVGWAESFTKDRAGLP